VSDLVNVGVIGCGYWGPNIIRSFLNSKRCRLKWVCDKKTGRLEYIREEFPSLLLSNDYKDLLKDTRLDAVAIVTPLDTHFTLAREFLLSNRNVFIEKPFTRTSFQALHLLNMARQKKLKIGVGHLFEYHPATLLIKNTLKKEGFGLVCYYVTERVNLRPAHPNVNVVWDLATHDFSMINYLQGTTPEALQAFGYDYTNRGNIDAAIVRIFYGRNVFAEVHVGWLSANKTRKFTVYGSKKTLYYDDMLPKDKILIFDEGIDTRVNLKDHDKKELTYGAGRVTRPRLLQYMPLQKECQAFIDAILEDRDLCNDAEDGYNITKMLELSDISIRKKGKAVKFEKA